MAERLPILSSSLTALLALLLLGCTVYKAATASFTHDESFTYNHYVTAPVPEVVALKLVSPNNHLLNTLLMKGFAIVLGPSPLVLRLPNILAHLGFLVFTFLLLKRSHPLLLLPLFSLVNCNPYLLDFFALARGNGLSLFFMAGSLWFLLKFARTRQTPAFAGASVMAALAVLSHSTLVYYFLSMAALSLLLPLVVPETRQPGSHQPGYPLKRVILINAVAGGVLTAFLWLPVHKLVEAGQLFYGGENGFWKDTVGTLTETFFYGTAYSAGGGVLLKGIILLVMLSAPVAIFFGHRNRQGDGAGNTRDLMLLFALLAMAAGIVAAQFLLSGIKLPVRRYGLLFAPVFMVTFAGLLHFLAERSKGKAMALATAWTLAALFTAHTLASFSLSSYLDWTYERNAARVMEIVEQDHQKDPSGHAVTMGITWLFEPTVNFYRQTRELSWLKPATRDGPSVPADYYYVFRDDLPRIPLHGRRPVILFDDGETLLVRGRGGVRSPLQ